MRVYECRFPRMSPLGNSVNRGSSPYRPPGRAKVVHRNWTFGRCAFSLLLTLFRCKKTCYQRMRRRFKLYGTVEYLIVLQEGAKAHLGVEGHERVESSNRTAQEVLDEQLNLSEQWEPRELVREHGRRAARWMSNGCQPPRDGRPTGTALPHPAAFQPPPRRGIQRAPPRQLRDGDAPVR